MNRTAVRSLGGIVQRRASVLSSSSNQFDAIVAGAGPSGLTAVSNLLDSGLDRVLWLDKSMRDAGRLTNYREVPSNTKAGTFAQFAHGTNTFQDILAKSHQPNAVTTLEALPQQEECPLSYAVDMCAYLKSKVTEDKRVKAAIGELKAAKQSDNKQWNVFYSHNGSAEQNATAPLMVLATGSQPKSLAAFETAGLEQVDLDTVLTPSLLGAAGLSPRSKVAVIGSSHSAILVLRNLYRAGIPVVNFFRSKLLHAEYKDDWILYDNTGLKGVAQIWAREILRDETGESKPGLLRIHLSGQNAQDQKLYDEYLPQCTHIVQAVGFKRNPLPTLYDSAGTAVNVNSHNDMSGAIAEDQVANLVGCGIAYPNKVIDKVGNIEHAVGLWKFMKYAKTVVPRWVENRLERMF